MASSTETGDLSGRTALVTGGSAGIGRAAAAALAAAGARVLVVARGEERLRRTAADLGGDWLVADVTDGAAVERLASAAVDRFGAAPDVVVCAAGAFALAPIAATDPADFDRLIAANLRGPFLLYRAFLPAMLERRRGHVVGIGSIAGRSAFPSNGAYSASKFGLRGLHAVLDAELRGTGVRSTLVEPAATDTALWDAIDAEANPGLPPREAMMPPAAVADAVLFALTRPAGVDVRNLILESA